MNNRFEFAIMIITAMLLGSFLYYLLQELLF